LVINGTESGRTAQSMSFDDGRNVHPPVVTVLSPDGRLGFRWSVGSEEVTFLAVVNGWT
jgi:hypothetical protein